jgi:hypothetical protein
MSQQAKGTFEISSTREPPYDQADGLVLGRTSLVKRFTGDLVASSTVQMLGVGTPVQGSAAYVALERVSGSLRGRQGNFVLCHWGTMNRGKLELQLAVAPDSGTGALQGISGKMRIEIVDGQHFYELEYELVGEPAA